MNANETVTLKTAAQDNFGNSYPVTVFTGFGGKLVARVENTGGSWTVSTLMTHTAARIAIDFGQGWYCTNIQDLIAEVRSMLSDAV
jgi:hypothetical protein